MDIDVRAGEDGAGRVTGVFHDRRRLADAVDRLTEAGVPADSVRVFVLDRFGARRQEMEVREGAGALHGALTGAAVGAVVGVVIVILSSVGALGVAGRNLFGINHVAAAARAVVATAIAATPFGTRFGLGHWRGHRRIPRRALRRGGAELVVESDELASEAADVLHEVRDGEGG